MGFTDKNELHLFQPRLMANDQNFEMQFSVVTGADGKSLTAEGVFRSEGDQGGMYWFTEDKKSCPALRRPVRHDLSGVVLEYDYVLHGDLPDMDDIIGQVLTVKTTDGREHYVQLWLYTTDRPLGAVCGKETQSWEDPHYCWRYNGTAMVRYDDPFYKDTMFPAIGRTPGAYNPRRGHVRIDFDNLYGGWQPFELAEFYLDGYYHIPDGYREGYVDINDTATWDYLHSRGWCLDAPSWEWDKIDPTQIEWIQWGFVSCSYKWDNPQFIPLQDSSWFKMEFKNWQVTQGESLLLSVPPSPYPEHGLCFADDYDDNYDMTPEWLLYQMHYFGFRDWINFYIGASHFYDKKGLRDSQGKPIPDPGGYMPYQYVMKTDYAFNTGFESWYRNYLQWAKYYGYKVIHSISMENVDAPEAWWQRAYDGTPGTTMWVPTPKLVSFTNLDLQEYYKKYVKSLCDLSSEAGLEPIVQLGEPWWWWIEGDERQPPCFYDEATKARHLQEVGREIPIFTSCWDDISGHEETLRWLRMKNGEFAHILRDHIHTHYPDAKFTVLFFPPSVLDEDRVAEMIQIVNFPEQEWTRISDRENLDFFQIEDYDWVIAGEWDKNYGVYDFPWRHMKYQRHRTHYFAGFVLPYLEAMEEWIPDYFQPIAGGNVVSYDEATLAVTLAFDVDNMDNYKYRTVKFMEPDWTSEMIDIVAYDRVNNIATLERSPSIVSLSEATRFYILPYEDEYREELWRRVNMAALKGKSKGEVPFIWASAQILKEGWLPPRQVYIMEKGRDVASGVSLDIYSAQVPPGKENLLDVSKLQLNKANLGSSIVYDAERSDVTVLNRRYKVDLFAYTWIDVEPNTDYVLADESATQYVYVYADDFYGTVVALKTHEQRTKVFNTGDLTRVLVGLYVASKTYTGKWTKISLRKA